MQLFDDFNEAMLNTSLTIIEQGSDDRFVWADVAIEGAQLTITPEMAKLLLSRYPSLAFHTCKNTRFGDCLPGALLPHTLEHLIIDLLVERHPGEVFAGNTQWITREEQTMRIRISLPQGGDPAPVVAAFSEALLQLNGIIAERARQNGK
ncbi:MAG: hypothetical protein FWE41_04850 [Coriobacteriia bacterium]|nr:hypothetical protein [Coriobacteriia bacterium]MCL2750354.1 hypothetical protein [Coriobacteriia bacterium]